MKQQAPRERSGFFKQPSAGSLLRFLQLLAVLSIFFVPASLWASTHVVILAPNQSEPYRSFQQRFVQRLAEECAAQPQLALCQNADSVSFQQLDSKDLDIATRPNQTNLVLSLGVRAAERSLMDQHAMPRVLAMLPEASIKNLLAACCQQNRYPAVTVQLDPPLEQQVRLIKQLFPERKRIGVLLSNTSSVRQDDLAKILTTYGLELQVAHISNRTEIGAKLQQLLENSDLLLALPDPGIYNDTTIVSILLTSYRNKVPVIGYSEAMVKAGALASLYSSVEQQVELALQQVLAQAGSGRFLTNAAQRDFALAINRQVGRSMGLTLPSDDSIQQGLKEFKR